MSHHVMSHSLQASYFIFEQSMLMHPSKLHALIGGHANIDIRSKTVNKELPPVIC